MKLQRTSSGLYTFAPAFEEKITEDEYKYKFEKSIRQKDEIHVEMEIG